MLTWCFPPSKKMLGSTFHQDSCSRKYLPNKKCSDNSRKKKQMPTSYRLSFCLYNLIYSQNKGQTENCYFVPLMKGTK
jgi:hypothetical protein